MQNLNFAQNVTYDTLEKRYRYIHSQVAGFIPSSRLSRQPNKCRSHDWWENVCSEKFSDTDWLENFRVSKNTFVYICNELQEALFPKPNFLNERTRSKPLTVQKKVALSLYFLASCCEYRIVANQFGIHKATVCKALHAFVTVTNKILTPKHIRMPNEAEALESAIFFQHCSQIPNIIGAIDGSHIPILPPSDGYRDFVNRKGWPSMVLQGVVNHHYQFIDISIKNPGATHDAAVLTTSNFYKNIDKIMPKGAVNLRGKELPFVIVGDPAYSLLSWLMKGYSDRGLTPNED